MVKKLLTIAMIAVAVSANAEVKMEFRDGNLDKTYGGGCFFSSYDSATGVTTFKSINSNTTVDELATALNVDPSNVNADIISNITSGSYPRYIRTKAPSEGNWEDAGLDANHTYLAFDYKVNKAHNSGAIYWQEGLGNPLTMVSFKLTVSDEWQTCYTKATPADGWANMANTGTASYANSYMWMVFTDWATSADEIVLEVKNLRFLTAAEYLAERPASDVDEPTALTMSPFPGQGTSLDQDDFGEPVYSIGNGTFCGLFASTNFTETIPDNNTILNFKYKTDMSSIICIQLQAVLGRLSYANDATNALNIPAPTKFAGDDIQDLDAEWNTYTQDISSWLATENFAVGDILWMWFFGAAEGEVLYLKDVRLVSQAYLDKEEAATGIQAVGVDEDSEVVASQYFDLQGRQLKAAPENGLYLRRDIRANGTAKTVKAIK